MAGRTTAFVIVGEYATGPFAARTWKARHGIALIEKHRRAWMPAPVGFSLGDPQPVLPVYLPWGLTPAQELVIVIAATALYDAETLDALEAARGTQTVNDAEGTERRWIGFADDQLDSEWPSPDAVVAASIEAVSTRCRLGVVHLEPDSELDDQAVLWLRTVGMDVDDFTLNSPTLVEAGP